MKSPLFKILAATVLVANAQAQVNVLSVSWREKSVNAPEGMILPSPGVVYAPRGYIIFDQSVFTDTPGPGTLIEYRRETSMELVSKTYTINSNFQGFFSDAILGGSAGRRMYGSIYTPVETAGIANASMPFTGSYLASGFPNKIKMPRTIFQVGSTTGLTGPRIAIPGTLKWSEIYGSASQIRVNATTIAGATAELVDRLQREGFSRGPVAPVITTDLPATLALQDGQAQVLSVGLGADVFPTPSYRWFRDDVLVSTASTFTVIGADPATGNGNYRVEVSTALGTAVSGTTTVTALANSIGVNLPTSVAVLGANFTELSVVLDPLPIIPPTYQWFKNGLAITEANGGTGATLIVIGGEAITGAGTYRVQVTNSVGTLVSGNCVVTVSTLPFNFAFLSNTPRTFAAPFATPTNIPGGIVNTSANPAVASRQWFKAPTSDPTAFVAIPAGEGGISANFEVVGNTAASNGPGVYRLVVTSTTGSTITSISTVVTSGP